MPRSTLSFLELYRPECCRGAAATGRASTPRRISPRARRNPPTDTWPKYAVVTSSACGLGDRLTGTLTVFLYALLSNRTFEYVWYGNHDLWASLPSMWIDWRSPPLDRKLSSFPLRYHPEADSAVASENHAWRNPYRSRYDANFFMYPGLDDALRSSLRENFTTQDITAFGAGSDVVVFGLNQGLMHRLFQNPALTDKLRALGLTWQHAVPCLFNYLYVPSPAGLAPFADSPGFLDKLLDPDNYIIGLQIRVGDWVFDETLRQNRALAPTFGDPWFQCALELTEHIESSGSSIRHHYQRGQQTGRRRLLQDPAQQGAAPVAGHSPPRVYWLLVSDSEQMRQLAMSKYPDRILTAANMPLDHIQEFARRAQQQGLHVAAGELWLFGLAHAHIVTIDSAYGRLGALAGQRPSKPLQVYGIRAHGGQPNMRKEACRLDNSDPLDTVATWWIGMRH